jgi:hypothetical protein
MPLKGGVWDVKLDPAEGHKQAKGRQRDSAFGTGHNQLLVRAYFC